MPIAHSTVVVVADDGTSPVGTDEWNAEHSDKYQPTEDVTLIAGSTSIIQTDPLIIDSPRLVTIPSTALLWTDTITPQTLLGYQDLQPSWDEQFPVGREAIIDTDPFILDDGRLISIPDTSLLWTDAPRRTTDLYGLYAINIVAFGAVGDDATDCSAAIQAAVSAAGAQNYGTVIIPPGNFRFGTTITVPAYVQILGMGKKASVLRYTGSTIGIDVSPPFSQDSQLTFRDFKLCTSTNNGTIGIRLSNVNDMLIDNIEITSIPAATGWTTAAIQLNVPTQSVAITGLRLTNNDIHENAGTGLALTGANGAANHIYIGNNRIRANHLGNISVPQDVVDWTIIGNNLEAGINAPAVSMTRPQGLLIHGNYFEQISTSSEDTCLVIAAGAERGGITITGNWFQTDAVSGTRLGIDLNGASNYMHGVVIQGNGFSNFVNCINNVTAKGAVLGPNFIANGTFIQSINSTSENITISPDGSLIQSIAFASSITPDVLSGPLVVVGTLTGAITINAPLNPYKGAQLTFFFTQDGTGGRSTTWNAAFKAGQWQPDRMVNAQSAIVFVYDGTNWLPHNWTTSIGLMPEVIFTTNTSNFTGTNVNTAQPVFPTTDDTITVPGAMSFFIDACYHIDTTGTTSHQLGILFGGTATYTSFGCSYQSTNAATEVLGADSTIWATGNGVVNVSPATATATHHTVRIKGIIRFNASGTFIPQYQWSAAPGVAGLTLANSYFMMTPFGYNAHTSLGGWS